MEVKESTIISEIDLAQKAEESIDLRIEIGEGKQKETINKKVPQNIAGLDPDEFEALAQLYFTPKYLNPDLFLFGFLMQLIGVGKNFFDDFTDEIINDFRNLVKPFLIDKPIAYKCLYPFFEIKPNKHLHKKVVFYGPGNGLVSLLLDEYILCELCFGNFMKNKSDIDSLNRLANVLYRQKGLSFKQFMKEEEKHLDFAATHFEHKHKMAAVLNYMCMRNWMANKYHVVFKSTEGDSNKGGKGWRRMIVRLCGDKFGNPKETRFALVHDVMEELAERKENAPKK